MQSMFLDQLDTRIGVTDFFTALQVNTKYLPKQLLILVELLRLPQYLLANTYARQTRSQIHITIHMPQKWNLSSSVKSIFSKTRVNRILVKKCIVFIANCDAQCNQELQIVIIERN